jgi:hypothetical protein
MPNKAHTFTDNFNDNVLDGAVGNKWFPFGPIQEVNQRLEIRPLGTGGTSFGGCTSQAKYDLTNSFFQFEVLQALRPVSGALCFFKAMVTEGTDELTLATENGVLSCSQTVAGTQTFLVRIPYEPASHRWWRLRENQGVVYWEVSADGKAWNVLFSKPNPFPSPSPGMSALSQVQAVFGAGTYLVVPSPGLAIFDSFNSPSAGLARRVEERRLSAQAVREQAAELAARQPHAEHVNNNDEVNYPDRPFVGNYAKGLKHDSVGDPDPVAYGSMLRALESRDPADFEELLCGILPPTVRGPLKQTNPQAGLAFDLAGPDAQAFTMPPAPRFDSEQAAAEMGELYWMALARDVSFINYAAQATTAGTVLHQAISSLNTEFPRFGGTVPVTAQNLFRGIYPGEQVGPYVSQFLLRGNIDPRRPNGQGRDADEGFIIYGSQIIDQRQWTVLGSTVLGTAADYLTDYSRWREVQNGRDDRGRDQFDPTRRFIRNLRDGANYVHFDQVVNAWWNAAFYLLSEPRGDQDQGVSGTGRPQADMEFSFNTGNPYDPPGTTEDARKQVGFVTFGPVHVLQVLNEVAGRAARAVWWQKWGVHRRLRPEEYGGRIDNQFNNRRTYPLHPSIITSLSTGGLAPYFPERYGSYLLPQAYPEGAPTHPAYGSGHAAISGACATILKAFFDEKAPIEYPREAIADGTAISEYQGADKALMTVGGELNKLAGNIAIFRNAAGVHWRSDYTDSLPLGEKVAIGLLQEMSLTFNEDDAFFQFTKFDGTTVRIHHGCVEPIS